MMGLPQRSKSQSLEEEDKKFCEGLNRKLKRKLNFGLAIGITTRKTSGIKQKLSLQTRYHPRQKMYLFCCFLLFFFFPFFFKVSLSKACRGIFCNNLNSGLLGEFYFLHYKSKIQNDFQPEMHTFLIIQNKF